KDPSPTLSPLSCAGLAGIGDYPGRVWYVDRDPQALAPGGHRSLTGRLCYPEPAMAVYPTGFRCQLAAAPSPASKAFWAQTAGPLDPDSRHSPDCPGRLDQLQLRHPGLYRLAHLSR